MTKDEALKLALEALELEDMACRYEKDQTPEHITKAITAIREALAQPEQEPVAFGSVTVRRLSQRFENHHDQYQFYPAGQSPYLDNVDECHTVYTTPPQRKPLTYEIKQEFWIKAIEQGKNGQSMNWQKAADFYADAIEAAHGIKE